ncbi:MFS transporter [uncultured Erythrobacter sp.]|uniref:MFS transporter n=1 Tax=uncultured Erythrobacter sp. TaxID=263913 RepID=UPI00265A1814|nr:MFS transporter [uncultured Erythrobacter sp.]
MARSGIGTLASQRSRPPAFFLLLSLPSTAMGLALSVQISVLSWILATRYGLEIHEIGLVWAAGPLAGIAGQLLIGALSDRVWIWNGRRRFFIITGGLVAAVSMLLLPQIGVISSAVGLASVIGVAITVALALDLAVNVGFNPARTLIADVTTEGAERTRGYSTMQVVSGSFGVGAYAIAALFGNDALIYVAAGFVVLFTLVPSLLIAEPATLTAPETLTATTQPPSLTRIALAISPLWALLVYNLYGLVLRFAGNQPDGYVAEILCASATLALIGHAFARPTDGDSIFRRIVAASALCWLGVQPIFVFMVSFLQDRIPALDDAALGQVTSLAFLALNAVAAIAPLALGPLARVFGAVRVHGAALCIMAAGCFAVWFLVAQPWQLYLLMAVCGIGWGSIVSLPFAIMSSHVDGSRMGLYMGLFNLSVVLPQLVSSLGIAHFAASTTDTGLVFALSGGFISLSALLWFQLRSADDFLA